MSIEWITLIAGFSGTILGVSIPSFAKYLENKSTHSKENKEKHEVITRKILTEFIQKITVALFYAERYLKDKENNNATRELANNASSRVEAVHDFYNEEIKKYYPLEMHSKFTDLDSELVRLFVDIGIDDYDDVSSNLKISQSVDKCEELTKSIIKHIEKYYI